MNRGGEMANYVRLCKTLNDKGRLIKPDQVWENIDTPDKDYYVSVFKYNDNHLATFKQTGSIRGIRDVTTNTLLLDFDVKDGDITQAKKDAVTAASRLTEFGIKESNIQIYFSGNKGFHVSVDLNRTLTPEQAYSLAVNKYGKDLATLDTTMYDAPQLIRVPGTRHPATKLYKIPLTFKQLQELSVEDIKKQASNLDNIKDDFSWEEETPGDEFFQYEKKTKEQPKLVNVSSDINYADKPKGWRNCKWAIAQGEFQSGERHQALLVLAATCRGLGYDKEQTYYLCKSALKKQAVKYEQEEFPKEELFKNIIEQSVFTDKWEGGQYSCQKEGWLKNYCTKLGNHSCQNEKEEESIIQIDGMFSQFEDYAQNFDKNVVKTGIKTLDEHAMLCSSTLNGLLGQPGAGKTSMSLNYLRNTSLAGIQSTFFSLDMGMPIVAAKLVQKQTGVGFKEALSIFKNNPAKAKEIVATLRDEYKNVGFNYKSGLTVPDMKRIVEEQQERTGQPVKLVIVDYLECLSGPYSDPTANAGFNANQLKDMANELNTCVLLLLQTQKHSVPDVSDPLLTLKGVKGSSLIEQSCSTILTLWREGYNPKHVENDKYISFAVVKNRFGSLWQGDFGWHGVTGNIEELSQEQEDSLQEFRKKKRDEKLAAQSNDGGWG
jgi:hypothetical protein